MKYYYEIALHETGGEVLDLYETNTKAQALKICKKIASKLTRDDFINDKYYIQVQQIDNNECSTEYMCWVDLWEYNPITKELE